MKTIQINIPNELEAEEKNLLLLFASILYEKGKLSLGQAAEIVGLSKRTFAELLANQGVSIFNYPASDLAKELKYV